MNGYYYIVLNTFCISETFMYIVLQKGTDRKGKEIENVAAIIIGAIIIIIIVVDDEVELIGLRN